MLNKPVSEIVDVTYAVCGCYSRSVVNNIVLHFYFIFFDIWSLYRFKIICWEKKERQISKT